MKIIVRIILAAVFVYVGLNFLLPHNDYPIEHFEQFLIKVLPFSWKFIAIFSRVLVSFFFVFSFLLLFYWERIKWIRFVSILMISIPFIVNPIFPENFKDVTPNFDEIMIFSIENPEVETVLIYVSPNCLHCKEALIELESAKNKNSDFYEVKVISYNSKIQEFMDEELISLQLDTIPAEMFLNITKGTYPKFQLVKGNKILKKWSNGEFNYAVLDNLVH